MNLQSHTHKNVSSRSDDLFSSSPLFAPLRRVTPPAPPFSARFDSLDCRPLDRAVSAKLLERPAPLRRQPPHQLQPPPQLQPPTPQAPWTRPHSAPERSAVRRAPPPRATRAPRARRRDARPERARPAAAAATAVAAAVPSSRIWRGGQEMAGNRAALGGPAATRIPAA